uniref:C-type lectin domain-containing protein n=1 Tax=Salarias fasciatus TaxID=181472 RepID=A0A672FR91_SALFA
MESFHRKYHYVNQKMTWTDAQSYCRENYNDLATFESMEDIEKLNRPNMDHELKWIGLYDDPDSWIVNLGNDTNSWRWSATETTSRTGYHNWTAGQPSYSWGKDLCVKMQSDGTEEENSKVLTEVMSNVWIGLYRIPWRWSDGSNSTFKHWQAGKPNSHNNNEHCTVELSNHVWNDKYCYSKYAFICQEGKLKCTLLYLFQSS